MKKCCAAFCKCQSHLLQLVRCKFRNCYFLWSTSSYAAPFSDKLQPGPLCHLSRLFFFYLNGSSDFVIKFTSRFSGEVYWISLRAFSKSDNFAFYQNIALVLLSTRWTMGNFSVNILWTEILRRLHFQQLKDTTTMKNEKKMNLLWDADVVRRFPCVICRATPRNNEKLKTNQV